MYSRSIKSSNIVIGRHITTDAVVSSVAEAVLSQIGIALFFDHAKVLGIFTTNQIRKSAITSWKQ